MATTEAKVSIAIRDIKTISEMREVEDLQRQVWGVDDVEVFPALALIAMREVGAVLIGAFDGERMIGFVFGFPGLEQRQAILHSDMLAVKPEYRSAGLGYQLKLAQRERALALGLKTITWTFDPLQTLNARLNFGKLGVVANRYCVDFYGETTSFLHQTGTDRLWVTWLLDSERVLDRIGGREAKRPASGDELTVVSCAQSGEPVSINFEASYAGTFAIEIPAGIDWVSKENAALALRWREATRKAFTKLIDAGFQVTEFQLVERSNGRVGQYLLTAPPVSG